MSDEIEAADHIGLQKSRKALTGNRRQDRSEVIEALNRLGVGAPELAENIAFWLQDRSNAAASAAARQDYMKLTGVFAPEQKEEVNKFSDMPHDELILIMLKRFTAEGLIAPGAEGKYRAVLETHVRLGGMLVAREELPEPRADTDEIGGDEDDDDDDSGG